MICPPFCKVLPTKRHPPQALEGVAARGWSSSGDGGLSAELEDGHGGGGCPSAEIGDGGDRGGGLLPRISRRFTEGGGGISFSRPGAEEMVFFPAAGRGEEKEEVLGVNQSTDFQYE